MNRFHYIVLAVLSACVVPVGEPPVDTDVGQPVVGLAESAIIACNDGDPCTVDKLIQGTFPFCMHTITADGTVCGGNEANAVHSRCYSGSCIQGDWSCELDSSWDGRLSKPGVQCVWSCTQQAPGGGACPYYMQDSAIVTGQCMTGLCSYNWPTNPLQSQLALDGYCAVDAHCASGEGCSSAHRCLMRCTNEGDPCAEGQGTCYQRLCWP